MSPGPGLEMADGRAEGDEEQKQGLGWAARWLGPQEEQWALGRENTHVLEINPTFFTFALNADSTQQKENEKNCIQSIYHLK